MGLRHALRSKGRLCQADSFNVFNRVRFAGPNLNITNVNFGRITAVANSPRAVQFNARISF